MLIQPNWNIFKSNAKGNLQDYFEWFCYLLFCRDFNRKQGIHRYKNQAGIETDPIEVDDEVISWQAKYYEVSLSSKKVEILKMLQSNRDGYPNLTTLYFYTNQEWSTNSKGGDPKAKVEAEKLAAELDITLIWKTASFFESEFVTKQHWDVATHFFTFRTLSYQSLKIRYNAQLNDSEIKNKYIHEVHTVVDAQRQIHSHFGGKDLHEEIQYDFDDKYIPESYEKYVNAVQKLRNGDELVDFPDLQSLILDFLDQVDSTIIEAYKHTLKMYSFLEKGEVCSADDPRALKMIDYGRQTKDINEKFTIIYRDEIFSNFHEILKEKSNNAEDLKVQQEQNDALIELVNEPYYSFSDRLGRFIDHLAYHCEILTEPSVYLHAAAGKGKTHVSFNIVTQHIAEEKPAVFVKGKRLTTEEPLAAQLLKALELSSEWSLDAYLNSLNLLGEWHGSKVPFVIDGIHESKHWSSIWKRDLGALEGKIKSQYRNILLIVTYRTSYEEELLDLNHSSCSYEIRRDDNFDDEAVYAYFDYFKINLTMVGHASRMLYHPLYLRLFCETKNPSRSQWVDCSAVKEDIFEVFEEYVLKRNQVICGHLKKRLAFNRTYLDSVLLTLSKILYESNKRGVKISEVSFSEDALETLISEDVLFFLEYNAPEKGEEIQIAYDLLAGYYIAKYLLKEYCISAESTIAFFNSEPFYSVIVQTDHPLYEDILRSLLVLIIKNHQVFFWDLPKESMIQNFGVAAMLDVTPEYLQEHGKHIQQTLRKQFNADQEDAKRLISDLKGVRFDPRHPLNMWYVSSLLQSLNMADRDLIWTEYVRGRHEIYGDSKIIEVLEGFEKLVTEENSESEDRKALYACFAFWCLTSTVHDVRNTATQALHYYFIKNPEKILDFLGLSFTVDDIYVRERVLAAVYGAAMNAHGAFLPTQWLSEVALWVYEKLFSPQASAPSSHLFVREYASGIISLATSLNPTLLSPQQQMLTKQPYPGTKYLNWQEEEEQEPINPESHSRPIHMDFENYTIGGLVPDRRRYHNDHPEFKKILGRIYWRIYQLGYDINTFGRIDSRIENDQFRGRGRKEEGKIDRYGKKYSWIAYYEQAGYREDQGLLKSDYQMSDRRFAFDIDVSFPVKKLNPFSSDLSDSVQFLHQIPNQNFEKWTLTPPTEKQYGHLHLDRKFEKTTPQNWLLMYGGVSTMTNRDSAPVYDSHIRTWMELVTPQQYQELKRIAARHPDCSFPIFNLPDNYYVNLGEVSWKEDSDLPVEESNIRYNKRKVERVNETFHIMKSGKRLDPSQKDQLDAEVMKVIKQQITNGTDQTVNLFEPVEIILSGQSLISINRKEYHNIVRSLGYNVQVSRNTFYDDEYDTATVAYQLPFNHYRNESHHAKTPPGLFITPTLEICRHFDLRVSNQDRCMKTPNGAYATVIVDEGNQNNSGTQLAYVRKDLMQWYIKKHNLVPVWYQWCEKRYFEKGFGMGIMDGVSHVATHFRITLDKPYQFEPRFDSSEIRK